MGRVPGSERQIGSAIRPKNSRLVAPLVLYYVTQQIPLALINGFFIIWVHMKALNLLFHCGYDS